MDRAPVTHDCGIGVCRDRHTRFPRARLNTLDCTRPHDSRGSAARWIRGNVSTVARRTRPGHHSVYVVYLRNPNGDGKAGYYVGMTGLSPEQRFHNHKRGLKAARVVRKYGERLVPKLYAHLNPMPFERAREMEEMLADSLRKRGYVVFGGTEGRLPFDSVVCAHDCRALAKDCERYRRYRDQRFRSVPSEREMPSASG